MANNYSTPDPLRLPSIRSLEIGVYPANNNNTSANNANTAPVEYAQSQQQYQSQLRYSEEYYSHNNNSGSSNREMGYYGHGVYTLDGSTD